MRRTTTRFCDLCECSVAVANALPALKEAADLVTRGDHGAGVAELIDELLRDDLASRHHGQSSVMLTGQ